jgi:hypothetical protein
MQAGIKDNIAMNLKKQDLRERSGFNWLQAMIP